MSKLNKAWENFVYDFYDYTELKYIEFATKYLGYSKENPGMSNQYDPPESIMGDYDFRMALPIHQKTATGSEDPQNWFDVFFGDWHTISSIKSFPIENELHGHFSFYMNEYSNSLFFPDPVSYFLQVAFQQADSSLFEHLRDTGYQFILVFAGIYSFRVTMNWLLYINMYQVPWSYLVSGVDWMEEALQGSLPAFLGASPIAIVLSLTFGKLADTLSYIVFTMPYLPSEGERFIEGYRDEQHLDKIYILVFHYFPNLWYKLGVPNSVRENMFDKDPELLEYYFKHYARLELQYLPNYILKEFPEWKDIHDLNYELIDRIVEKQQNHLAILSELGVLDDDKLKDSEKIKIIHQTSLENFQQIFHSPIVTPEINSMENIKLISPVTIISDPVDLHFSLIDQYTVVLQNSLIQENQFVLHINIIQQHLEHLCTTHIDKFF